MKLKCDYCGKEFERDQTETQLQYEHTYCSQACCRKFRQEQKSKLKCDYCGKTMTRSPSRILKHNFCNRTCYQRHRAKELEKVTCTYCGRKFVRDKEVNQRSPNNFCGQKCYKAFRKRERDKATKIVPCSYCGKPLKRRYPGENNYCDKNCHGKALQNRVVVTCDYCGIKLSRVPSAIFEMNFCDHQCRENFWRSKYIEIECDWCGERLERRSKELTEHNFCNLTCRSAWRTIHYTGENNPCWQGGLEHYYGTNWSIQRDRARKRDNYCCRVCQIDEEKLERNLDVHHIIPLNNFDSPEQANVLANLVSLCSSHHSKLEHLSLQEQIKQLSW